MDNRYDTAFLTGPFTIEMWIYFDGDPNNGGTNGQASIIRDGGVGFVIQRYNGEWEVGTEPTPQLQVNQTVSNQTWIHIALVRDANNVLRFFTSGTKGYSNNFTQNFSVNRFFIGNFGSGGGSGGRNFKGYIDALRISKKARYTSSGYTPDDKAPPNK